MTAADAYAAAARDRTERRTCADRGGCLPTPLDDETCIYCGLPLDGEPDPMAHHPVWLRAALGVAGRLL